jgi:pyruvate formate lyase activating enzyme
MTTTGIVFNIQRFSIHDGPGIRTTVFLKGCSLHCYWCHNPEGIRPEPEIQFYPERCIGDGECARVCAHGAQQIIDGKHLYLRDLCQTCGECVEVCYAGAMELTGKDMTVQQVVDEVLRDCAFYETSGGGVTLSGGDPIVQRDFSLAILEKCKAEGLHTAIETTANCRWDHLEPLLAYTDLVLMDLKHMDDGRHRQATGVGNRRILGNARRLAEAGKLLVFRIPVIPGVNASPEEIAAIARFVRALVDVWVEAGFDPAAVPALELLPFHRLAGNKYESLGLAYRVRDLQPPTREQMDELVEIARACGISARHR